MIFRPSGTRAIPAPEGPKLVARDFNPWRTWRTRRTPTLLILTALLLLASTSFAREVPYLAGRVNDMAGLLSAETRAQLETRLAALEQEKGSQIAVLTIDTLADEPIELTGPLPQVRSALGKGGWALLEHDRVPVAVPDLRLDQAALPLILEGGAAGDLGIDMPGESSRRGQRPDHAGYVVDLRETVADEEHPGARSDARRIGSRWARWGRRRRLGG